MFGTKLRGNSPFRMYELQSSALCCVANLKHGHRHQYTGHENYGIDFLPKRATNIINICKGRSYIVSMLNSTCKQHTAVRLMFIGLITTLKSKKKKSKAIPETGRGGL
jgi:hypothetical protein